MSRMMFTSRGDVTNGKKDTNSGLHVIRIPPSDNNPVSFHFTVTPINLTLNEQPVGVKVLGTPGPNGYDINQFTQRATHQFFDLDIRNPTGIVVLPDRTYAFVADYYLPRMYYTDAQNAFDIESLHTTGSKIGIIKDPFGSNPKLVASTSPIPSAYLSELVLSGDGTRLYANYRLTGNILVFDVTALTKFLNTNPDPLGRAPVDTPAAGGPTVKKDGAVVSTFNKPGIDVPKFERGLAIQQISSIILEGPLGEQDVNSATAQDLAFTWKVDTALLGINFYKSNLYISTQSAGAGLWPDDPPRNRTSGLTGTGVAPEVQEPNTDFTTDGNPGRVFTSSQQFKGGLIVGHIYKVSLDRSVKDMGEDGTLMKNHETRVIFDKDLLHVLTAGQNYSWGVALVAPEARASAVFRSKPVAATADYGVVTVLTHGFQFGGQILPTQENTNLQAPGALPGSQSRCSR